MGIEFDEILQHVGGHSFWATYLSDAADPMSRVGVHVAIFVEPFLSTVLSGQKTIDSRFSRNRCSPYGEVGQGDIILIKEVAGPICGIALVRRTWCYNLMVEPIERIKERFGAGICASDAFWASQEDALYATLIELDTTVRIASVHYDKRDRRGWVSLRSRQLGLNFA